MSTFVRRSTPADGVALVTLDNAPLNLVTRELIAQLRETLGDIGCDDSIRAVVVTGAGERAFCAGSDIGEFADVRSDVLEQKSRAENDAFRALELLPQPTIAAIAAPAVGGGFELSLCCDLRIAAKDAWFSFPEVNIGVYPGSGGTFRLTRLVGPARAFELLYMGTRLLAAQALAWGVVAEVASKQTVVERAVERAAQIAAGPSVAMQAIKTAVYAGIGRSWEETEPVLLGLTERVFSSDDLLEGIAAFRTRRPPVFRSH